MDKTFLVVYRKGRKTYNGFAPGITGCGGLGYTLEGVRADLREGLRLYIESCIESGQPLPESAGNKVTVPVNGETDRRAIYFVERMTIKLPKTKISKSTNARLKKSAAPKCRVMQAA
jgi:predicted RNase H-like HicB family nuclease